MEQKPNQDIVNIISLLAGAAQKGAKGLLAQAAFNVVKASEAVVKSRRHNLEQRLQQAAVDALNLAQDTLIKASNIPGAMDEAKEDIIRTQQQHYQLAQNDKSDPENEKSGQ